MSRISNTEKAKYTRLDPESEVCFYCGTLASMDDLSPSSGASVASKQLFRDQWTIVRVCRGCWGRIYTVNIAEGGVKFSVAKGCMTTVQKRALISGNKASFDSLSANFVYSPVYGLIVASDTLKMDDKRFVWGTATFYIEEMIALQGSMAVQLVGLPVNIVEATFAGAMASGFLEIEREAEYRSMLRL